MHDGSGFNTSGKCGGDPQAYGGLDLELQTIQSFENAFFENTFFENFANFGRARSRPYQNEILQENMRSTTFVKLYKICILLHRCNLKVLAKNRFEKPAGKAPRRGTVLFF